MGGPCGGGKLSSECWIVALHAGALEECSLTWDRAVMDTSISLHMGTKTLRKMEGCTPHALTCRHQSSFHSQGRDHMTLPNSPRLQYHSTGKELREAQLDVALQTNQHLSALLCLLGTQHPFLLHGNHKCVPSCAAILPSALALPTSSVHIPHLHAPQPSGRLWNVTPSPSPCTSGLGAPSGMRTRHTFLIILWHDSDSWPSPKAPWAAQLSVLVSSRSALHPPPFSVPT